MRNARRMLATVGLGIVAATTTAGESRAQSAVAFAPTIGSLPDGVVLNATPVVSSDRRYVRMGVNPTFIGFDRFDTFTVPAAVSGGGVGAGAGFGGAGGFGGGFNNVGLMGGGGGALSGFVDPRPPSSFVVMTDPPAPRPKAAKGRARTAPKRRER